MQKQIFQDFLLFKEIAAQTTQKEKENALGKENIPLKKKTKKKDNKADQKGKFKKIRRFT